MIARTTAASAALIAVSAVAASAGGIERNPLNLAPLYEEGRYLELSAGLVFPNLEGSGGEVPAAFGGPAPLTGTTGNLLEDYATFGLAYKGEISDRLSYALFLSQPYGADTFYPAIPPTSATDVNAVYGNSFADLDAYALTTLVAYDVTPRVKVYGGPVIQLIEASAGLPFIPAGAAGSGYEVDAGQSFGFGAVVGASYSIPDIALRVGLTYKSSISHEFDTTETLGGVAVFESQTDIDTPQEVTLDFQTGIAQDTLLFGQARWVDWSEFEIAPPNYPLLAAGRPLVAYEEDWYTFTLGLGRRFTENWSGALSATWEPATGAELTSLGPIDGRIGITAGATYENERFKITGGVNYSWLGDTFNVLETEYDGGTALGLGIRFGIKL
ncbi:MAG: outer membrane protein transport protein [Pseudomonadota bacterium]